MKKVAVITGGTKGIGKSTIFKFAKHGYDIITCARTKADLQQLEKEISTKFPDIKFFASQVDMSEKLQVLDFAKFINSTEKSIAVLVNNAGVFLPGEIRNEPDGQLETTINTNLYGAYYLTRSVLPNMIKNRNGHIINICSIASITPYSNGGSYSISKYAMLGMTKVLREEMKQHGIRVTAVLPGATLTTSWEGVDLPDSRFIKSDDVADAIYGAYSLSKNAVVEEIIIRPHEGDI